MSLLLVTHGTRNRAGQRTFAAIRDAVAARVPDRRVHLAHVDVQTPLVADAVQQWAGVEPLTVIPVFLGSGYHVHVDIPAATTGRPVAVTEPLGPEPELIEALAQRWLQTDSDDREERPVTELVLGATGSSDPRSLAQTRRVADLLAERLELPVTAAFCAAGDPEYGEVVRERLQAGVRFGVVSHLVAPGYFHRKLVKVAAAGPIPVSAPIGPHPALIDLLLRRADEAGRDSGPGAGTLAA